MSASAVHRKDGTESAGGKAVETDREKTDSYPGAVAPLPLYVDRPWLDAFRDKHSAFWEALTSFWKALVSGHTLSGRDVRRFFAGPLMVLCGLWLLAGVFLLPGSMLGFMLTLSSGLLGYEAYLLWRTCREREQGTR